MTMQQHVIKRHLTQAIVKGHYPVGSWLPSAEELALKSRCSPHAVRRAYRQLSDQGILHSVKRKGTRVVVIPPTGRILFMLTGDPHLNLLVQEPISTALVAAGYDVDFQPLKFTNEPGFERMRLMALKSADERIVVGVSPAFASLKERAAYESFAGQFAGRVVMQVEETYALPDSISIIPDPISAARQVAQHLSSLGHRRVGVVAGNEPGSGSAAERRATALAEFLGVLGASAELYYYCAGSDVPSFINRTQCTAWWALTDHQALVHMLALQKAGMQVPRDISVVGMFDTPWATQGALKLTSVSLDPAAMGQAVSQAVDELLSGSNVNKRRYVHASLRARETTSNRLLIQ